MEWLLLLIATGFMVWGTVIIIQTEKKVHEKDKQIESFKETLQNQEPLKYYVPSDNPESFKKVIELIDGLSVVEKQSIIQQCFGRPVKFIMGMTKDGTLFFECVSTFDDFLDKVPEKPEMVG